MITVFDAPGAGTGLGKGTFPYNSPQLINPNGAITGYYVDSVGALHGFLRDEKGVIATYDVPAAGTGPGQGTFGGGFSGSETIMSALATTPELKLALQALKDVHQIILTQPRVRPTPTPEFSGTPSPTPTSTPFKKKDKEKHKKKVHK